MGLHVIKNHPRIFCGKFGKCLRQIFFSDPNDCLTPLSMQALPDAPESLCIAEMGGNKN